MEHSKMMCSICNSDFDIDEEGGIEGFFGIIPVSFCPTCYCCILDMTGEEEESI